MKEMLKSKTIIVFVIIILGITFIGSTDTKLEDNTVLEESYLTCNLK